MEILPCIITPEKGGFMPHYLNLNVILRYDFIITYLAIIFLIQWIDARFQLERLSNVFPPSLGKQKQADTSQQGIGNSNLISK